MMHSSAQRERERRDYPCYRGRKRERPAMHAINHRERERGRERLGYMLPPIKREKERERLINESRIHDARSFLVGGAVKRNPAGIRMAPMAFHVDDVSENDQDLPSHIVDTVHATFPAKT